MFDLDPDETATTSRTLESVRLEPPLQEWRNGIQACIGAVVERFGGDVEVASVSCKLMVDDEKTTVADFTLDHVIPRRSMGS